MQCRNTGTAIGLAVELIALHKGSDCSGISVSFPCHHVSLLAAISILASKETAHIKHLAVTGTKEALDKCLLL